MAVKIKLKRLGKIRSPHYRIVVADSRTRRDGRAIEEIGLYHPVQNPSRIEVDSERAQYWLGVGAQPTEPVLAILKVTGDWQKFKGLPAPEPMKVPEPKADKRALFEAAAKDAADEPKGEAVTPKAKKADKADKAEKAEKSEKSEKAEKAEKKADAEPGEAAAEAPGA
ncbi:30S ribosomal protein S16 [Streptomyces sp. WAC 06738]|uniref:30S ribosomal protein S16 n=1 Tax=Streptomyces sp. WAC 06738 TaxID=2203210 RepID=UPI000F6E750E|nr:30S ribosomal protein S16 [Streptomyces sp. WAC 06738]AZM49005.1 30S ribosomal protein S16 [Streptomyces sp. WAC 06738]